MTAGDPRQADPPVFAIRAAAHGDIPAIHSMIAALAEYEKLSHLCVATEADLADALFGPRRVAEVLIACKDGETAAFALFFHNFSTFLGRPGLWLEDLFVKPAYRRQGCAQALLRALAALARDRGCGRFEWAVLDWNAPRSRSTNRWAPRYSPTGGSSASSALARHDGDGDPPGPAA